MGQLIQATDVEIRLACILLVAHGFGVGEVRDALTRHLIYKEIDSEFNQTYLRVKGLAVPAEWLLRATPSELRFDQGDIRITMLLFPVPNEPHTVEIEICALNGAIPCPDLVMPEKLEIAVRRPFVSDRTTRGHT